MTDIAALKATAREIWSRGDYVKLATQIEPAARELVDACAISAGQEVLDVAAGNGNLAVLAAREGAAVVASDLTPAMLELGRMRTEGERLGVEWVEADAEALPFEDERFDCAASFFGAMFARRPEVAARELVRVVRRGGDDRHGELDAGRLHRPVVSGRGRLWPALPRGSTEADRVGTRGGRAGALSRGSRCRSGSSRASCAGPSLTRTRRSAPSPWPGPRSPCCSRSTTRLATACEATSSSSSRASNRSSDGSVELDGEYLLVVARRHG